VTLKPRLRSLKVTGNGTIGSILHDLGVVELFDLEYYCDLEMWVTGTIRKFGAVSYCPSIVTMALSCIICEIERDIGHTPLHLDSQ